MQLCVARVVVENRSPERYINCSMEKPTGACTMKVAASVRKVLVGSEKMIDPMRVKSAPVVETG
jgi:hypothetical protein